MYDSEKENLFTFQSTYPDDDLISTSGQEGRRFHIEKEGLSGEVGLIGELRPRKEPVRPGGTNVSKPRADDWRRIGEALPTAPPATEPPLTPPVPATVRLVLLPVPTALAPTPPPPPTPADVPPPMEPPGPDGVTTLG